MLKKLFNHNIAGDVHCVMVLSRFLISVQHFIEKRGKTGRRYNNKLTIGSFRLEYEYGIEYLVYFLSGGLKLMSAGGVNLKQ